MPFLPLGGLRVVDVTTSYAGPYCTQLLAALGADVVKVEPPGGDEARAWGPPFVDGDSALFLAANAGKRSLAIDLRRGADALRRLAEQADVFVQSLRPGLADELGLGAERLRAANERLVYCSIGSYGHVGPKRLRPGYDALMQAAGGVISVTGEPGRPGVRVGVSLIGFGSAPSSRRCSRDVSARTTGPRGSSGSPTPACPRRRLRRWPTSPPIRRRRRWGSCSCSAAPPCSRRLSTSTASGPPTRRLHPRSARTRARCSRRRGSPS